MGTAGPIPHSQVLRSRVSTHECPSLLQALQPEAVRGFGGLVALWGSAAWLETPGDAAWWMSSPGLAGELAALPAGAPLVRRVQSRPTWDGEQLIFPICTTISF